MGQSCFNSSYGPGFCQVFLPQFVLSQAGLIPIHILSDTKYSKLPPGYHPPLALLQRNLTGCNLGDGQWFGIFLFVYPEPLWGGSRNNCQVPPGPFISAPRQLPKSLRGLLWGGDPGGLGAFLSWQPAQGLVGLSPASTGHCGSTSQQGSCNEC